VRELPRGQAVDAIKPAPDFHTRKFRPHHAARRDARVEIVAAECLADERTAPILEEEANLIVAHENLSDPRAYSDFPRTNIIHESDSAFAEKASVNAI
jgi:hypothetical protein